MNHANVSHYSYWGHVNPIGPRSCYDEGKRVAESLMVAYAKQVQYCVLSSTMLLLAVHLVIIIMLVDNLGNNSLSRIFAQLKIL